MIASDSSSVPKRSASQIAFAIFLRLVAVGCLVAGLKYWAALIGIFDYAPWRFDLMPVHWKLAATVLAVLFPVAATGLWIMVAWGPVVWFAAAATESAMYGGFPALFGHQPIVVALHASVALVYLVFRLIFAYERRRRREPVKVDSLYLRDGAG